MDRNEFRKNAHTVVDWIADYLENIEQFPVRSRIEPGTVKNKIPVRAPEKGESFEALMHDLNTIILPGITHWQHPGFMALFPSNSSDPSLLAEFIMAGLGVNTMVWETSPAATELEESMMQWLRDLFHLPETFQGVIHDTASTSTLVAVISAREKKSEYKINADGFNTFTGLVMYCSDQTHYSIEKDAKAAGIGRNNVRKIKTDAHFAMDPTALEKAIQEDIANNKKPFMVVATLGTTSSLAFDPLEEIGAICKKYALWLHVDAAYAGSAFILPEYHHFLTGVDYCDSYVFNPHKWLFTNFDCSVYFVKDAQHLINVFSSDPDYLKRTVSDVINYKDWGINLGRRFRALKLWFVLRMYGAEGLKTRLREHIRLAGIFHDQLLQDKRWELMAPFRMNMLCIRYHPDHIQDNALLNTMNETIVKRINASGKFFISGTKLNGCYVIRIVIGQTYVELKHVEELLALLNMEMQNLSEIN